MTGTTRYNNFDGRIRVSDRWPGLWRGLRWGLIEGLQRLLKLKLIGVWSLVVVVLIVVLRDRLSIGHLIVRLGWGRGRGRLLRIRVALELRLGVVDIGRICVAPVPAWVIERIVGIHVEGM